MMTQYTINLQMEKAGIKQGGYHRGSVLIQKQHLDQWKPQVLNRHADWRPKFLTEFLMRTLLTLDTGSRWFPLLSGSAPIHQPGKESIWFHLLLLWSGTSCLLSLMKIAQYLNACRAYTARAVALYFSQFFLPVLPRVYLSEQYAALASGHYCDALLLWRKSFKNHSC